MENKFLMAAGRYVSVVCVSSMHFARDHLLAGDLLHGRLGLQAGYGAAYVKKMYSEYER